MDESSIKTLLETTGLPVAYHHYDKPPPAPYIVFLFTDSANFGADNKVYEKINNYQVELYSALKDITSEGKIETVLDGADIYYDKTEVYIDSEKLYQVSYFIEV